MLVSTETLAARLGDPDWIVFDTRHDLAYPDKGRQAWHAAHIPGAYFMHLDEDLSVSRVASIPTSRSARCSIITSGYVERVRDRLPRQGSASPWRLYLN